MLSKLEKAGLIPTKMKNWYRLRFVVFILLIVFPAAGCTLPEYKQPYKSALNGVILEKPGNWDLTFNERNGVIELQAGKGVLDKDSARVELGGSICVPDSYNVETSQNKPYSIDEAFRGVEMDIQRIKGLYDLEEVKILQQPLKIETKDKEYEVIKAIVAIPTTSMRDQLGRIQVGDLAPNKFQIIEIFFLVVESEPYPIRVYIYKGNSHKLNKQAEEIVNSIVRTC